MNLEFNKNEDAMKMALSQLKSRFEKIVLGGGKKAIEKQRVRLQRAMAASKMGGVLSRELDLAAGMAAESCRFMLWQQARAAGKKSEAKGLAQTGIRELQKLDKDFSAYWPERNKATPLHCSAFLKWRMQELRQKAE